MSEAPLIEKLRRMDCSKRRDGTVKRGDILLVHSPLRSCSDIISLLIRKITRSYWNHAAWVLNEHSILESHGNAGVIMDSISKYEYWNPNLVRVCRIKKEHITEEQLESAINIARSSVGSKYDWLLIWELFKLYVFNDRHKVEASDNRSRWICSELIAKPLWLAAKFKFCDVPVSNVVPGDIANSPFVDVVSVEVR